MITKKFALLMILSIAVLGIVAGTGINANDFINNNDNITNATPWIHYVEAGNASDIQAKIDSLPASGGMVFVPAGVYNTTAIGAINITKSNVILRGAGESTVIFTAGTNKLLNITNANYVSISDIYFYKGEQFQILLNHADNCEIANCRFSDVAPDPFNFTYVAVKLNASSRNTLTNLRIEDSGIELYNSSDYNIISNCKCSNCDRLFIDQSDYNKIQGCSFGEGSTVRLTGSSHNKIILNEIGIAVDWHIMNGCNHNLIEGNKIYTPSGSVDILLGSTTSASNNYNKIISNNINRIAITLASTETAGSFNRHNIIANNIMNGEFTSGVDAGIQILPDDTVANFDDNAFNLITGNKIYNYNSRSIYLKESCYNTITENECWNSSKDGILLWMHSDYNIVTNNNCHDNTDCGIMLEDSNRYNLVTDNYCNNNEKDGIMVYKSDGNIVSDNYLYQNGYCGLWLHVESDSNTITGNIAANNGWNIDGAGAAKAQYSGIRLDSNCDNNQINSNRCFDHQGTKT